MFDARRDYYGHRHQAWPNSHTDLSALLGLTRKRIDDTVYTMMLYENAGRSLVSSEWLEKAEVMGIEAREEGVARVSMRVGGEK